MDQLWEIVGIIVAVLMVVIGLRLILKKPKVQADDTPSEVLIEAQSQQPVTPRHLRNAQANVDHTQSLNHAERKQSLEQVFDAQDTDNHADTKQTVEADGFELDGEKSQVETTQEQSSLRANTQQDLFSADPDDVEIDSNANKSVEIETVQTEANDEIVTTNPSVAPDKADEIERFIEQLDNDQAVETQKTQDTENDLVDENTDANTTSDNPLETVKI